ncbi:MAG: YdeI/OmpD-associated family protein [Rhodobacteraceae bacterium]|nr:YdeI/OmpD-associated family protein [Paracoccaceae bacterium]
MIPEVRALLANEKWHLERISLRNLLLECGLDEAVKWGKLCYTFQNSNVAIFFGLKDYCGLGFFKGVLLADPESILHRQGPHSQAMRLIRFTNVQEIADKETVVKAYVHAAIALEKAGLKVDFKQKDRLVYPDELQHELDANPALKKAFEALTPGRRRAYNLYFTAAKQSATRHARIRRYMAKILDGKGMNDR